MNSFSIKILDPTIKTLEIETTVGSEANKLDIITYNNNNIIIENSPILLPADYINSIDTEIVSYLDAGSGINLSSTSSGLTVNVSGLNHTYIGDFDNAVSGLLPPYVSGLHVYVKNATSTDFTKGQVVYVNSAQGNNPTISLAIASAESTSSKVIGLLQQDIAKNQFGYVVTEGILEGVDTGSAIADGDTMWLSPTVSGGVVYGTANKPLAPYHLVFIGYVLRKQQNNGRVFIKPQNGFELGELHNVAVNGVPNGSFLQYNSASGLWMASTSGTFSSLTVNGIISQSAVHAVAGLTTDQTIITASGDTILALTDKDDPNNWWNDSTYRFLPTKSGYYNISAQVNWDPGSGSGQISCQLRKNGTSFSLTQHPMVTGVTLTQNLTGIVNLNGSTDYVDIIASTSSTTGSQVINGTSDQSWTKLEAYKIS